MSNVLMQTPDKVDAAQDWQLAHEKISNQLSLTVVSGKYDCANPHSPPIEETSTGWATSCPLDYFFTSDGFLRGYKEATVDTTYNGFQTFQGRLIPRKIALSDRQAPILQISVDLLEPLSSNGDILTRLIAVPKDAKKLPRPAVQDVPEDVPEPRLLQKPNPEYPEAARRAYLQGRVVILASIDDQGKVREPYVVSSAGDLLDAAGLEAARKWRFEPALLNGEPVIVEKVLNVAFSFRR